MSSVLIVITFLAGASWGPAVSITQTTSAKACEALMRDVAQQIASAASTNLAGGASTIKVEGDGLAVMAGAQGSREMARVSCSNTRTTPSS